MGSSHSISVPGGGTEGYHVLRVQDNSPGKTAGLEAFFDFILAIGNTRLDQDNDTLKELLKANIDKEIQMTVYSSKTQNIRLVDIVPSSTWGGQGLLGVSIRFCSFEGANENVWHILEIHPSSPAEEAGLIPFTDYIIGADSILHESEDLFTLIESHEGRPLKMYVYNTDLDRCREVTITPNSKWGGEGSLGCGIGYGYLHRIPIRWAPNDGKQPANGKPSDQFSVPLSPPSAGGAGTGTTTGVDSTNANRQIPFIPMVPPLANTFASVANNSTVTDLLTVSQPSNTTTTATTVMGGDGGAAAALTDQFANLSTGTTDLVNNNAGTQTTPIQEPYNNNQQGGPTEVASPPIHVSPVVYTPPTPVSMDQFAAPPAAVVSQSFAPVSAPPQVPPVNLSYSTAPPLQPMVVNPYSMSSTVPPPSTLSNDFYQMYGTPVASTAAPTSYATTIDFLQSQQQQQQPSQQQPSWSQPPIQMYSTYPQVQPLPDPSQSPSHSGTGPVPASTLFQSSAVTTPISLPGMPPITVSATIQPEALRGLQFTNAPPTSGHQPPVLQ
ncbi:golgi family reassembly stacking protein 2 (grasp2) [Anopheles darlingi]|uniref:Golgi family reassembly stacking protein 2 (Grasp2) n=1 Tax=Anopheles darlingi TaxID=43151 RepID=W5JGJ3_ANODA|nr:Golgi reassembly-stacking protein 2 [Anopheles darlingi]XP_049541781.1 Golgi reassembly-stacking protein 2 [Anopheles darlingi]ETN63211.1 golgi family reassembly stacking protein 2 (grasp2) [Anopheles darlingi]